MIRIPRWLLILLVMAVVAGGVLGGVLLRSATPASAAPATILGWSPGITRGVPPAAPLTVYFSRSMDHASVEQAWRMSPPVGGSFAWSDTAVAFHPTHPLRSGAYYQLRLGAGARDDGGNPLRHGLFASFATGDALRVVSVSPASGTAGVPANAVITVTFNHPMVPLAGLDVPVPNPPGWGISMSPATPGQGRWIGTSTWVFYPDRGLIGSSRYILTLSHSIADVWGDSFEAGSPHGPPMRWAFHTATPAIVQVSPINGTRDANPQGDIRVTFNQKMDPASAGEFTLRASGAAIPGSTRWVGDVLDFHPTSALDSTQLYTIAVSASARSINGAASLGTALHSTFRVAPPPRVLGTDSAPSMASRSSQVALHFSAPMDERSLNDHLTISPSPVGLSTYLSASSNSNTPDLFVVNGTFQPSADYTLTVGAGTRDRYGRALLSPYSLHFTTLPLSPSVVLYGFAGTSSGISFSAGRVMSAPEQMVNVDRVHYTLVRTSPEMATTLNQYGGPLIVPQGTVLRDWSVPVSSALNRLQNAGVPLMQSDGSPLPVGTYWLGADVPGTSIHPAPSSSELVAATNVGITMKISERVTLVWVTSARTGRPLAGQTVRFLDYKSRLSTGGQTDANGVFEYHYQAGYPPSAAFVEDRTHFGLALSTWQSNTRTTRFGTGLPSQYYPPPNGTYLYTDRPIYRPGQTVHFRGIVWRNRDGVYARFGRKHVTVSANDGSGKQIFFASLPVDRFGSIRGNFVLPPHIATGNAGLAALLGQSPTVTSFGIAEYRKPEFLASVTTDRPNYVQGQTMNATVQVRYVFGAPVAGQQMTWTAYRQDRLGAPPGFDSYQFGDQEAIQQEYANPDVAGTGPPSQFGYLLAHGAGRTDAGGRLTVHVPVDIARQPLDQTITLEATATDINQQSVSARAVVPAYKASYAIGLAGPGVVNVGTTATFGVVSVRPDGAPVGSQALTVTTFRRTYSSMPADNGFGSTYWRQIPHDIRVSSEAVTTDRRGMASFSTLQHAGGEYYLVVEGGGHSTGGTARSGIALYVGATGATGTADWGPSSDTAITLQPDRKFYRVGETAHILVAAPFPRSTALITTERGGIREYHVQLLTSGAPTIDVPVTLNDLPNVFVTVTLYRGWRHGSPPDWRSGVVELHVNLDPRRLVVRLVADRVHYHPGDPATFTIHTTDIHGRPAQAQLSLALVDTAVLALQDEVAPSIVRDLYGEQLLQVSTASDGVISIDHVQQHPAFQVRPALGLGGGGGGGPPASAGTLPSDQVNVRHRFADTAFWTANLVTDGAGRATVHVVLPDNLTTWRLDARGVTAGLHVGQSTIAVVSTQDIVLRPVTPRFLVQGDKLRLGAVVNNTLGAPVVLKVSMARSSGVTVANGDQTVAVPAHGARLVLWDAVVPEGNAAVLTFRATPSVASVRGDAVQVTLPVHPPLTDETVATSGQVFGRDRQMIIIPAGARSSPGGLTVEVSSALTAGMGAAFASLRSSPYESNDDIAARMLAVHALQGLSPALSGLSPKVHSHLTVRISRDAEKLLARQHTDGSWAWFQDPQSPGDTIITSDIVQALAATHVTGAASALERGRSYLVGQLPHIDLPERAHVLLVLAETSSSARPETSALFANAQQRARVDVAGIADLAMALHLNGDHARAQSLAVELDSQALVSATGAHWEASPGGGSAVGTTAHVLDALNRIEPNDPFVPAAARWLMLARNGSAWDCNRDTALSLRALAAYAMAARDQKAAYHYAVLLDGQIRLSGSYTGISFAPRAVTVPVAGLPHPRGTLTVERQSVAGNAGPGNLYYVARLRYYLPAAGSIPARNAGVTIGRRYLDLGGKSVHFTPAGTSVRVEITVTTGQTLTHLDIEDPIPAGFEPIDQSLNTTRRGLFPAWQTQRAGTNDLTPYLAHSDLRDDRVSLYVDSLPPGTYVYSYLAQATVSGRYGVAPSHAAEAFFPEVFGRSSGAVFTVSAPSGG